MRGFGFREHGDLERLTFVDLPEPAPGPGAVRIRVSAAAFNRLDRFVLAGIPGVPVERPHVLGSDGCGVVDFLGEGVTDVSVGDRVILNPGIWDGTCAACRAGHEALCPDYRIVGEHTQGTAAPLLVVPRRNLYPHPSGMTDAEAAACPLVFQTAWRALRTVGDVQPGDRVAVIGAGGGVSTAAIQVANRLGAQVTVASRSRDRAERSRSLGATDTVVYSDADPLDRALWSASGKRGFDVIFDSVGAPTLPRSVRAIGRGGRVVVIGATAGPVVELDVRTLFWRNASIRGSTMAGRTDFEQVLDLLANRSLRAVVDSEFSFDQGLEAFRHFASGDAFGKVVLKL